MTGKEWVDIIAQLGTLATTIGGVALILRQGASTHAQLNSNLQASQRYQQDMREAMGAAGLPPTPDRSLSVVKPRSGATD